MQEFTTEIGGKKFACTVLGVREHMTLQGRVSAVIADGLRAAIGREIEDVFKGDLDIDADGGDADMFSANILVAAISGSAEFRRAVNWKDFQDLVIESCETCELVTDGHKERLNVNDLDASKYEQYKVFFWFLECQLGNFTGWNALKSSVLSQAKGLVAGGKKS